MELYGFIEISGRINEKAHTNINIDVRDMSIYNISTRYNQKIYERYDILVDGIWITDINHTDMNRILDLKKSLERETKINEIID